MYEKLINNFNYYSEKLEAALKKDNERVEIKSTSLVNAIEKYQKDKHKFERDDYKYNYIYDYIYNNNHNDNSSYNNNTQNNTHNNDNIYNHNSGNINIIITNGNIYSLIEICLFCVENKIKAKISSDGILENTNEAIIQIFNNTFENSQIKYIEINKINLNNLFSSEEQLILEKQNNAKQQINLVKQVKLENQINLRNQIYPKQQVNLICIDNVPFYKNALKKQSQNQSKEQLKNQLKNKLKSELKSDLKLKDQLKTQLGMQIIAISLNAIDIFYDSDDFEDIVNTMELYCDSMYIDYHTYKIKNQYEIKIISNKETRPDKAVILTKNAEKYNNITYYKKIYINQKPF